MKQFVLVFLVCLLIVSSIGCQNNFNLVGVIEPTESELKDWNLLEVPELAAGISKLRHPARDLTALGLFPIPGNQGDSLGSCTAWALCYALKTFQEAIDRNYSIFNGLGNMDDEKVFSPSFLFKITTKTKDDCKNGVYLKNALDNLKSYGTVPISLMPYSNSVKSCSESLPEDLKGKGIRNRILEYYTLRDQNSTSLKAVDLEKIKQQINNGKPVVFAIHVDEKWEKGGYLDTLKSGSQYIWKDFSNKVGNHAMLCVGYNDTLMAFKALNSFGSAWVNNGYILIDYELFRKRVSEAYIVEDYSNKFEDRFNYKLQKQKTDKSFLISSNDSMLVADGNIQAGKYIKLNDYKLVFQGFSKDKENALYQIEISNENKKTILANVELEVGGGSKVFQHDGKVYNLKSSQPNITSSQNSNSTRINLQITNANKNE